MKKFFWAFALLMMLLPQAAFAENLIENAGFEEVSGTLPAGWQRDMWLRDEGVSELLLSEDAYEGNFSAEIINYSSNDARFTQTVRVEPNTLYRISCRIKAEGVGEEENGANISIEDTFAYSELLYDTQGEWVPVELYGTTGEDQTSLTIMARLGGYSSTNVGKAWFDSFEMQPVSEAPEGFNLFSFATFDDESGFLDDFEDVEFENEETASSGGAYTPIILLAGILSALILLMGAHAGGRGAFEAMPEQSLKRILWVALAVGLVVRAVTAVLVRGYSVDMGCFEGWSLQMLKTGPSGFYSVDMFCDYPPGYMYVLWLIGFIRSIFGIGYDARLSWLLLKLPAILMDLAAAYLLYSAARKPLGERIAVLLGVMYALLPAAILNSAAWGQIDAVFTILLILTLLKMEKGNYIPSLLIYGVAIMVKPQALIFAPLGLFALGAEIYWSEDRGKTALRILAAVGLMLAEMLLIALPFLMSLDARLIAEVPDAAAAPGIFKPIIWLMSKFTGSMDTYPNITVNACNLYTLLDMNWKALEEVPFWNVFANLVMMLSYVYAMVLYLAGKRRDRLMLVCATLMTLVFSFAPMMHERYLFPAILLLLFAYRVDSDIRLIIAAIVIGLTQFLNAGLVLQSEHLIAEEQGINAGVSVLNLLAAGLISWTAFDICLRDRVFSTTREYRPERERHILNDPMANPAAEGLFHPKEWKLGMKKLDWILMLALTAVYAVVALSNLGSTQAPQTSWKSTAEGEEITFDLGDIRTFHMTYYGGICTSSFTVQLSEDGEVWSEPHWAVYDQGEIFRWLWYVPSEKDEDGEFSSIEDGKPMQTARYVRITSERAGLILNEIAFIDEDGNPYPISSVYALGGDAERANDPALLIDEQDTVPAYPSYYNGTYFDEIYHARTAYEHKEGLHTYEYTHPPLGKVLIMVGIDLFGMTPFGWRFMGTLFGILMIPAIYMLAKQLLRKTSPAFLAAFLLSVDAMHFTQSRIATIDIFAVFFIVVMYLFMLRYLMMSFFHVRLWRTIITLGFCGLFMGFAIASKWIGIYAAGGLAFLFFYSISLRAREYRFAKQNMKLLDADQRRIAQRAVKQFWRNLWITLAWCVVFFIVIPLLIYYFSYYWQLTPDNNFTVQGVWETQESMYSYHSGLGGDTHFFRSPWYEWPLIIKPMWYYSGTEYMPSGMISSISCMGNPAVWWGGLAALIFIIFQFFGGAFLRGAKTLRNEDPGPRRLGWMIGRGMLRMLTCLGSNAYQDRRYIFVIVGFLSQYLPWILVPRSTFIYHYFASVPFIILAAAMFFDWLRRTKPAAYSHVVWLYGAIALLMFIAFYPLMSGTPCLRAYANLLRWFNWYNF